MNKILSSITILLLLNVLVFNQVAVAQVASGGEPHSWTLEKDIDIEPIFLPEINLKQQVDSETEEANGAYEFAKVIEVNISNMESGQWEILSNGDKIWTTGIISSGAYSLNFTFSKFIIPDGASVYVYSPDQEFLLGAFTSFNQKKNYKLAIAPVPGDELVIEYYEPENADFEGVLEINRIGHAYKDIFGTNDNRFGLSGSCNIDINCTEGADWQKEKRAVCRMIVDNSFLCTGTLVNNTKNDGTPYVFSANHCIDNQSSAENSIFTFNYESAICDGTDGEVWQTISGSDLIATKNEDDEGFLDFSLLKLSIPVPDNYFPYFAGWDSRNQAPASTTCVHHPNGDVKKISIDNDNPEIASFNVFGYDEDTFWKILEWDKGTTEEGSSGGPLFDQNKRIVGSLTGGEASCGNSVNDLFQMFSAAYDNYSADSLQLKKWLDPDNSGITFLDGYEPKSNPTITDKIYLFHFDVDEELAYVTTDGGYVSGNNAYVDIAKAEYFDETEINGRNYVVSAFAHFYLAKGSDDTEIEFFIMDQKDGKPGNKIGSAHVSLKEIKEDVDSVRITEFDFYPPININTSVYFGVTLPQTDGDSLVLFNTLIDPETNYAWEQNFSGKWLPYSSDNSWGGNWINYLGIQVGIGPMSVEKSKQLESLLLYPNPVAEALTMVLPQNTTTELIHVYNSLGKLMQTINNIDSEAVQLNVSSWNNGFYIVRVKTNDGIITSKFIKQ